MKPEDIQKMFGKDFDITKLKTAMEDITNKVNPFLDNMVKENQKILKPKSAKNIKFNGVNVGVSLIEDGRIIINFPTLDDATKTYDKLDDYLEEAEFYANELGKKTKAHNILLDQHKKLFTDYKNELNKKWYHKLFGK